MRRVGLAISAYSAAALPMFLSNRTFEGRCVQPSTFLPSLFVLAVIFLVALFLFLHTKSLQIELVIKIAHMIGRLSGSHP